MGKPKHGNDTRGDQKGAQPHAEGQQGPKAREAFLAGISDHSRRDGADRGSEDPRAGGRAGSDADDHERRIENPDLNRDGKHRLFENRTQHDEAEQGSERTRRDRDVNRHGHDREAFQGHAGTGHADDATAEQPDRIRNVGQGGGNRSDADRGSE